MIESGYGEAAKYLQDLIYDNVQLVKEDDIGIVVDLRKRPDYLEHIADILQKADKEHEEGLYLLIEYLFIIIPFIYFHIFLRENSKNS